LEKRVEQVLPGNEEWERGHVQGTEERNDPNNICTYVCMNKEKKIKINLKKEIVILYNRLNFTS
jgi:hypothetical protein